LLLELGFMPQDTDVIAGGGCVELIMKGWSPWLILCLAHLLWSSGAKMVSSPKHQHVMAQICNEKLHFSGTDNTSVNTDVTICLAFTN